MTYRFGQLTRTTLPILWMMPILAFAGEEPAQREMTPDEQAWEKVLEENLGSFYLPAYKKAKLAGRETAWDYVEDDPKLPRVLLIGDSISRGYTIPTRKALAGKVNVHRAPANCGPTKQGLEKLDLWLQGGPWDVIHFNFGIHDRKTPPAQYEERLEAIVKRLQQTGAKLVWATTTPISPETPNVEAGSSVRANEIAAQVMQRHSIPVNDLYAHIKPTLAKHQRPKDCHFNQTGYEHLGKKVAEAILNALD